MATSRPRANATGFYPASGTNYSYGQEPELARRLRKLADALKLHLVGISGYRSPQHSVAVGGFADDPHTRGQASDTPGVENIPETTLRRFGLTRPFPGAAEADHIQLLGGAKGTTTAPRAGKSTTLADLWIQAGGARNLAPIMAAIAMAESGGKISAVGGPNSDGSYDYGLWQINSIHTQFDHARLTSDGLYNARAAVAIYRSQGLRAWTTYSSGAYKQYLGSNASGQPTFGRTRPGGSSDTASSDAMSAIFASYAADGASDSQNVGLDLNPLNLFGLPTPSIPNPLDLFKGPAGAISSAVDFLKWIAWIFNPKNILRIVEFVTGSTIMVIGIHSMFEVYRNAPEQSAASKTGRAIKRDAGQVFQASPAGRALRTRRAVGLGKRAARAERYKREGQKAATRGKVKEGKRESQRNVKRDKRDYRRGKGESVPF